MGVLRLLLAAMIAWLGVVPAVNAAEATDVAVAIDVYEATPHTWLATEDATERGPPATYDHDISYYAVELWSHGASARPDNTPQPTITTYAYPGTIVQAGGVTTTTSSDVVPADGALSSFRRSGVAAKTGDEFVNLASDARTTRILQGDATGGEHLWPGLPGKTPFPKSWSSDRVMHEISDVAIDPASVFTPGRGGSTVVTGTRDGVDIRVILRGGDIITGYPTDLARNP